MRRLTITCAVIASVLVFATLFATVGAQQSSEKTSGSRVRIGTFDSRAVAMAYYRSKEFNLQMSEMHAEHKKAKQAGDEERVKELEEEGPALQQLVHKQGFSTWPVDNILEKIKDQMPAIAARAEADVIVSKWDITYQKEGIQLIDVTDLMVKPFDPDEATLKIIAEIRNKKPVPVEDLEGH